MGSTLVVRAASDGSDTLEVVSATGAVAMVDALSRGTCEQLYLCLRLSLARALSVEAGRASGFPVLLDDVLVNFDPDRSKGCAALLADLAKERQVVMFTCRKETEALLRHANADLRVEHLVRYAGRETPALPEGAPSTAHRTQQGAYIDLARRLESRLKATKIPQGKSELLVAGDEDHTLWAQAREYLIETGVVIAAGHGRGRKYALLTLEA